MIRNDSPIYYLCFVCIKCNIIYNFITNYRFIYIAMSYIFIPLLLFSILTVFKLQKYVIFFINQI